MTAPHDPAAGRADDARGNRAAGTIDDDVADAADQAARRSREADDMASDGRSPHAGTVQTDELSRYVAAVADGIDGLARSLREKSADELMRDLRRFADRNPTLYLAGSVALGFALTRFSRLATRPDASTRERADGSATGAERDRNEPRGDAQ